MATTYEPIATTTISNTTTTSVTFSSISAGYTDLRLVFNGTVGTAGLTVAARFNGDTGTNYSFTNLRGNGTAAASSRQSNYTWIPVTDDIVSGGSTTIPSFGTLDIFSYAGSTNKTALGTISSDTNGSGTVQRTVNLWRNTAAITSITVFITSGTSFYFGNGATATLYGIKAA